MAEAAHRIVLDTNVLLVSISSRSRFHWIFKALIDGKYQLPLSNEILAEYEEIIGEKYNVETARHVVRTLLLLPNVLRVEPVYRWNLVTADPDDNKFVDCAVAANAHALVSEDRHFNVLTRVDFPRLRLLRIAELEELLGRT